MKATLHDHVKGSGSKHYATVEAGDWLLLLEYDTPWWDRGDVDITRIHRQREGVRADAVSWSSLPSDVRAAVLETLRELHRDDESEHVHEDAEPDEDVWMSRDGRALTCEVWP